MPLLIIGDNKKANEEGDKTEMNSSDALQRYVLPLSVPMFQYHHDLYGNCHQHEKYSR